MSEATRPQQKPARQGLCQHGLLSRTPWSHQKLPDGHTLYWTLSPCTPVTCHGVQADAPARVSRGARVCFPQDQVDALRQALGDSRRLCQGLTPRTRLLDEQVTPEHRSQEAQGTPEPPQQVRGPQRAGPASPSQSQSLSTSGGPGAQTPSGPQLTDGDRRAVRGPRLLPGLPTPQEAPLDRGPTVCAQLWGRSSSGAGAPASDRSAGPRTPSPPARGSAQRRIPQGRPTSLRPRGPACRRSVGQGAHAQCRCSAHRWGRGHRRLDKAVAPPAAGLAPPTAGLALRRGVGGRGRGEGGAWGAWQPGLTCLSLRAVTRASPRAWGRPC